MRDYSCSRSPGLVALLILSIVLLGGHEVAIGQVKSDDSPTDAESTPEEQTTDETPEAESEPEKPGAPDKQPRRRILKRIGPQPMTAEEREEAERLRKIAARYGTDPTAIVGRFQLSSQYLDLPQSAQATATTLRVDVPFRGDYLLRMDMPFLRTIDPNSPNSPGMPSQHGLSDLTVTAGWRVYNTPKSAVLMARCRHSQRPLTPH